MAIFVVSFDQEIGTCCGQVAFIVAIELIIIPIMHVLYLMILGIIYA